MGLEDWRGFCRGRKQKAQQTCCVHIFSAQLPRAYTIDLSVTSGLLRTQTPKKALLPREAPFREPSLTVWRASVVAVLV